MINGFRGPLAAALAVCALSGAGVEAAPGRGGGFVAPHPAGTSPAASLTAASLGASGQGALQTAEQATSLSALGSIAPLPRDTYAAELPGTALSDVSETAPAGEIFGQDEVPPDGPALRVLRGRPLRPLALKQPVQTLLTLRAVRPSLIRVAGAPTTYQARPTLVRAQGDSVVFLNPKTRSGCGRFAWRDGAVVYALTTC